MNTIKIIQLFETYGEQYQPYIPPVIEALKNNDALYVSVVAFNASARADLVLPSYKKRKIKENWYAFKHANTLNYLGILCLEQKIDILHIQQSYMFSKALKLIQLEKKRPKIIITLRGGDTYVKPWYMKKWTDFYSNYGNKVDAFVVMSDHQKEYLHKKWHIEKQRIHIIPISFGNTFQVSERKPNTHIMKVVSAYRMCWEKNIEGNLRTIKILKEKGIFVKYDIFGDGSDIGQVHYLIDKYQLSDCVDYYGKIDNKDLKTRLTTYDFFLQLSHSESLGMSVIEAQTLGLPAIVSNSDGLPEVVLHNKTGFCVAPHDSESAALHLEHLWQHADLYIQFSKEAILHSHQNFTVKREVDSLKALYANLLTT